MYAQILQFVVMSDFGEWLKGKRLDQRLTLETMAHKTGLSKQYISVLERGQPHALTGKPITPKLETVDKIARALGVPSGEARHAAGYAAPITEPQTIRELKERLWDLGIHLELADEGEDGPEAVERAKASIAALMNAIFPPHKKDS